jgi:hypothetical protein
MVDKTSADWNDVLKVKQLLIDKKSKGEIKIYLACLSHVKYPLNFNSATMHYKRQKYRKWLMKQALQAVKPKQ